MEDKTSTLKKELTSRSLDSYIKSHDFDTYKSLSFSTTLQSILADKSLKPRDLIKKSSLTKSYVYAILNGTKRPSRDKIIVIALSINSTLEECNELLKSSEYRNLHPKSKRESIIIYSLNNNKDLIDTNIKLEEYGEKLLP